MSLRELAGSVAVLVLTAGGLTMGRPAGPLPAELAWIGLFNGELVRWLENRSRLDELCSVGRYTAPWHACRDEQLQPKILVIPLRAEPRADAARVGEILVLAQPDKGLQAFASAPHRVEPFTPDLHDSDWGYGPPYFHQTVLGRKDTWYRIPVPLVGPAWIDSEDLRHEADVTLPLEPGDVITLAGRDLLVLGMQPGVLRARPEQPADMWCQAGEPPPLAPWRELRIPFEDLFDPQGHLRIRFKYTRGC